MNTPITITPAELGGILIALCGAIIAVAGAVGVIIKAIDHFKKPNRMQDKRIGQLEADVKDIRQRLEKGDARFREDAKRMTDFEHDLQVSMKVVIESLQALTSHAIDGNNTEELRNSKKRLDDFLLEKI